MDELSPEARALLRAAASSDDPSADDLVRVRQSVLNRVGVLGITAAVAASSTQARAASLPALGAKLSVAVAFAVGGMAAWSYFGSPHAAPTSPSARAQVATDSRPADNPVPAASAAGANQTPPEAAPAALPTRSLGQPAPQSSRTSDLASEMGLIQSADAALRSGNTTKALALLDRHQVSHARGSLAHEREGLRALAHCQQGRAGSLALAKHFLQGAPRSPLAARIRQTCNVADSLAEETSSSGSW